MLLPRPIGVLVACAFLVGGAEARSLLPAADAATPCKVTVASASTLRAAAAKTNVGDVCVKPGVYVVTSYLRVASGVRLHGAGAKIFYTGARSTLGLFNAIGTHDILVEGFVLDGTNRIGTGFRSQNGAHHITVRGLNIWNMGEGGIQFQKSDHVVAVGNKITHAGYTIGWGSGIGLWFGGKGSSSTYDAAPGFHAIIVGNVISDIVDASGNDSDGNGIIVDGGGALYPVLVTGNVIHDVRARGVTSIWNSGELWVVNNTVVRASNKDKCEYASYSLQGYRGKARWVNNISQPGCGPNYGQYDGSTGYSWTRDIDSNTKNTGLRPTSEVRVINPALNLSTYTLLAGSPAINAAVNAKALMSSALQSTGGAYLPTHHNVGAR